MAGSITVGGKTLASHSNSDGKLSINNDVVFPAGHVVQVKQTVIKNHDITTTSQSYVPMQKGDGTSPFAVTHACASGNKVLIHFVIVFGASNGSSYGAPQLWIGPSDGSSAMVVSEFISDDNAATTNQSKSSAASFYMSHSVELNSMSNQFIYTPSTTTELKYQLYWKRGAETTTLYLNRTGAHNNNLNGSVGISTMTLYEIAG